MPLIPERLSAMDGVRGWAAFSVLLFHAFFEMFRAIHPVYASPLLFPLMCGNFAVMIFFVLSGHVLSYGFMKARNYGDLKNLALKRYPRLAIPVLLSCLIVFACMQAGLTANHEAGALVHREDWLGNWLRFGPDIQSFFKEVLFNTFFTQQKPIYNRFLWTMFYELSGSVLVFITLLFYPKLERPLLVLCVLAVCLLWFMPFIGCFVLGMICSDLLVRGTFASFRTSRRWQITALAAVPVSYLLIMTAYVTIGENIRLYAILGFGLIMAVHIHPILEKAMNGGVSQYLGRLSFPLYLMHFAVIVTFSSWMTVALGEAGISILESLLIGIGTVIVSLCAAQVFMPVEVMTVRACRAIAGWRPIKC